MTSKLAECTFRRMGWNKCALTETICVYAESNKRRPTTEGDCRICNIPIIMIDEARAYIKKRIEEDAKQCPMI